MKKFIPIIFIIFALLILFGMRNSKAEDYPHITYPPTAIDDIDFPDWYDDEIVDTSPVPENYSFTALDLMRIDNRAINEYNRTNIFYKPYTADRSSNSAVISKTSLTGGTSGGNNLWWVPTLSTENLNDPDNEEDFHDYRTIQNYFYQNHYYFNSYAYNRPVNINTGSYVFAFRDVPASRDSISRDYKITYTFNFENLFPIFVNVPQDIYTQNNISTDMILQFPSSIHYLVTCSDYQSLNPYTFETTLTGYTLSDFISGIEFQLDTAQVDDNFKIDYVVIYIVIDDKSIDNPILSILRDFYTEQNRAPIWGTWSLSGTSIKFSRVVTINQNGSNLKWWQKLLVPDEEWMANFLNQYMGSTDGSTTQWALSYRQLVYNLYTGTIGHFILDLPALRINIRGQAYQFMDAYTFDFTEFFNNLPSSVKNAVKLITDMVITLGFAHSVFVAVCGVFDIHFYKGVSSGGDDE